MQAHPPFAYLTAGDGPALCRRYCARLRSGQGLPKGSADGVTVCIRFCRGFAAGLPMLAARRPNRRSGDR